MIQHKVDLYMPFCGLYERMYCAQNVILFKGLHNKILYVYSPILGLNKIQLCEKHLQKS
jgi:hypothetical protein